MVRSRGRQLYLATVPCRDYAECRQQPTRGRRRLYTRLSICRCWPSALQYSTPKRRSAAHAMYVAPPAGSHAPTATGSSNSPVCPSPVCSCRPPQKAATDSHLLDAYWPGSLHRTPLQPQTPPCGYPPPHRHLLGLPFHRCSNLYPTRPRLLWASSPVTTAGISSTTTQLRGTVSAWLNSCLLHNPLPHTCSAATDQ